MKHENRITKRDMLVSLGRDNPERYFTKSELIRLLKLSGDEAVKMMIHHAKEAGVVEVETKKVGGELAYKIQPKELVQ